MEHFVRYLIMLNQHGEAKMPATHYSLGANLLSSRCALPPKLGLTVEELEDFLLILGKPLGEQGLIFQILARDKRYSFTTYLSNAAATELGWPNDE